MVKDLPDKREITEILKNIKDPESGISIYELNLIKAIDYVEKERKLIIHIDFKRRTPSCPACASIAWLIQKRITDELTKSFLKYQKIETVEFRE